MEQELKKEWLARSVRLIIRYAPSPKAQDSQQAYVGRYLLGLSETKLLRRPFIELQAIRKNFILLKNPSKTKKLKPTEAARLNLWGNIK